MSDRPRTDVLKDALATTEHLMELTQQKVILLGNMRTSLLQDLAKEYGTQITPGPPPDEPPAYKTPQQRRAEGQPYCPRCYTFGHEHGRLCPFKNQGLKHHVIERKHGG